uniref:Uncharacterized protein n=1 Tax=Plectus sambesii TaxID=2011161 RepID=A0A914XP76_9BILA
MGSYYAGDSYPGTNSKSTNSYRDYISGPHASSYEDYVKKIFKPGHRLQQSSRDKLQGDNPERGISALSMMRVGNALGKEALDNRYDDYKTKEDNNIEYSPLDSMYTELSSCGLEDKPYKRYQVYQPKQSSEYYSVMNSRPIHLEDPLRFTNAYREARTLSSPNVYTPTNQTNNYRASPESGRNVPMGDRSSHMLVDYKNFNSSPLSPYMYQGHPYVHREDSRIVGSDFVMLTLRPRDAFLDRIDKTLAEARAIPRY